MSNDFAVNVVLISGETVQGEWMTLEQAQRELARLVSVFGDKFAGSSSAFVDIGDDTHVRRDQAAAFYIGTEDDEA